VEQARRTYVYYSGDRIPAQQPHVLESSWKRSACRGTQSALQRWEPDSQSASESPYPERVEHVETCESDA
jgi:hypothetical protein